VIAGLSRHGARALLDAALAIERRLGRERGGERWGPRSIDIDLLAIGDEIRSEPDLVLPHPEIARRRFVLVPWAEVDPGFVVPGTGRCVAELLAALDAAGDRAAVEPWRPAVAAAAADGAARRPGAPR
jgi:2-amino-4-hydroxy-6-hydroxymethyldihydropteridine diphosphokinase